MSSTLVVLHLRSQRNIPILTRVESVAVAVAVAVVVVVAEISIIIFRCRSTASPFCFGCTIPCLALTLLLPCSCLALA